MLNSSLHKQSKFRFIHNIRFELHTWIYDSRWNRYQEYQGKGKRDGRQHI